MLQRVKKKLYNVEKSIKLLNVIYILLKKIFIYQEIYKVFDINLSLKKYAYPHNVCVLIVNRNVKKLMFVSKQWIPRSSLKFVLHEKKTKFLLTR